jgi:hypothetical protein
MTKAKSNATSVDDVKAVEQLDKAREEILVELRKSIGSNLDLLSEAMFL